MKNLFFYFVLFLMVGCSNVPTLHDVSDSAEEAADTNFEVGFWRYCKAQSMAAVQRRFLRNTPGLVDYLRACGWEEEQVQTWQSVKNGER